MSAYAELRLYAPTEADALAAAVDALPHGLELVTLSEDGETYTWRRASVDGRPAAHPWR